MASSKQDNEGNIIGYGVIIIAIIFVTLVIYINHLNDSKELHEAYVVYTDSTKTYCKSCIDLGRELCSECTNCGYCLNADGTGHCVLGNVNGPLNGEKCIDYEYTSPLYYSGSYPNYWHYPYGWYSDGWWNDDGSWHYYNDRDRLLRDRGLVEK